VEAEGLQLGFSEGSFVEKLVVGTRVGALVGVGVGLRLGTSEGTFELNLDGINVGTLVDRKAVGESEIPAACADPEIGYKSKKQTVIIARIF